MSGYLHVNTICDICGILAIKLFKELLLPEALRARICKGQNLLANAVARSVEGQDLLQEAIARRVEG